MAKLTAEQAESLPKNQRVLVTVTRDSGDVEKVAFRKPKRMELEQMAATHEKAPLSSVANLLKSCCLTHEPAQLDQIFDEVAIMEVVLPALIELRNAGVELEKKG